MNYYLYIRRKLKVHSYPVLDYGMLAKIVEHLALQVGSIPYLLHYNRE